jgi:hypothetical protein
MEEAIKVLLEQTSTHGIGVVVAAIFILLYVMERRAHTKERDSHTKTMEKLMELSAESIRADTEHASAIRTLTRVLDSIDRRVS